MASADSQLYDGRNCEDTIIFIGSQFHTEALACESDPISP
jgi:hypothetical protein